MNSQPADPAYKVLVVDDEPQIQRLLSLALRGAGYHVSVAGDGETALAGAAFARQDLILLDLGLPDMDGIEVLRRLREWTQTPVVVLTVQDGESEKITALDSGADDYIMKPFNTGELLARLRVALRHGSLAGVEQPLMRFGEVEVDLARRRVTRAGQAVKLTATEYDLFHLLVRHAGKVLTHRQILREVWGADHESEMQYLRVYVARLRDKLESEPASPRLLLTEPGVGYRLEDN
ncbi:MAG: response regulator transcription factor [Verrucomicrobiota bacterium]